MRGAPRPSLGVKILGLSCLLGLWFGLVQASAVAGQSARGAPGAVPGARDAHGAHDAFDELLMALGRSSTGRGLLARAQAYWNLASPRQVRTVLRWGKASRTDAVLTRQYDPQTGTESRERKVTIFLREGQPTQDLIFDLAHELIHATTGPAWDPYDPKLSVARYVRTAIEGDGGEVEAVLAECRVGLELGLKTGGSAERCRRYLSADGASVERSKVSEDFYRVGKWSSKVKERLGENSLPLLSTRPPRLYSSTGHAPYPVALIQEYDEITQIACENTRKRIAGELIPDAHAELSHSTGRAPASAADLLRTRCADVNTPPAS